MWDREWTAWATEFTLIRCDLPGFGRTPVLEGAVERPAAEVAALIDALDLGPASLVGASFGGRVALEVAVARPELVRRLLLVSAGLPGWDFSPPVRSAWEREEEAALAGDLDTAVEVNIETWVAGPQRTVADVDPGVVALVRTMQRRALELQIPTADEISDAPLAPDFPGRLGELDLPLLAVTGALDQVDFAGIAARIVSAVRGARRVDIAGAAHLPNLEQPAEFDAAALPFLRD
jgi:pimeloyl-ACP methyl ester carboxylesterase